MLDVLASLRVGEANGTLSIPTSPPQAGKQVKHPAKQVCWGFYRHQTTDLETSTGSSPAHHQLSVQLFLLPTLLLLPMLELDVAAGMPQSRTLGVQPPETPGKGRTAP